eukprot:gene1719-7066_t
MESLSDLARLARQDVKNFIGSSNRRTTLQALVAAARLANSEWDQVKQQQDAASADGIANVSAAVGADAHQLVSVPGLKFERGR